MKKGFNRLRGVAAAGAMGLGLFAVSGRAATTTIALYIKYSIPNGTSATHSWSWTNIGNTSAPITVSTTTGGLKVLSTPSAFGIGEGSSSWTTTGVGHSDAYDGAFALAVGGTMFVNPDTSVDLTNGTVTSDTVADIIPGVDATIQYHFFSDQAIVRALYKVTNTTGSPINTDIRVLGNLGSDSSTTAKASASGDAVIDNADRWYITDDDPGDTGNDDPVVLLVRYGSGAAVIPTNTLIPGDANSGTDNFGLRYDLTIPANESRYVMVFGGMYQTLSAATTGAPATFGDGSLSTLNTNNLLTGLSADILARVVNYTDSTLDSDGDGVPNSTDAFPNDPTETVDTDGDGTGNNADTDDDGDGVADSEDAFPLDATESVDTDGDGIGNNADTDDDGDGVADSDDAFPLDATESVDTDSDGIGNNADTDDDGDGVADSDDAFPLDATETKDSDSDGIGDNADPTPNGNKKKHRGGGAFSLPGLFAMFGGLVMMRRRRKQLAE